MKKIKENVRDSVKECLKDSARLLYLRSNVSILVRDYGWNLVGVPVRFSAEEPVRLKTIESLNKNKL